MKGWIKIYRAMLEWEHFKEPRVVTVFLAFLFNADKTGKTNIKLDELMSLTGLSHNTVTGAIAKLVKSGEITRVKQGQIITTTINKWNGYQANLSTQNLGECEDLSTQNLGEQNDLSTQKMGEQESLSTQNLKSIDPKNGTIINPKNGSIIYNKNNNKKDNKKEVVVEDAHARVIENLKTYDYWAENMCKNYHITHEQLCTKVDEFELDMACSDKKIEELQNARAYFNAWLSNKLNRNNGTTNQYTGNPGDTRTKLDEDAIKAMAALASRSQQSKVVPF